MFWFHSVLTSESAQAEAVLPTRCSARWDGTEAWAHPTYPGLIPIDAGSLLSSRREKERERRLKPSYCPAGLMREHRHLRSAAGNPGRAHGLPRNQPDPSRARRLPARPLRRGSRALPGRWAPPVGPARARRAPPASRPRPRRRRPPSSPRGGLGVAIQARARPAAAGKRQEGGGKRQRRCRGACPPAPT